MERHHRPPSVAVDECEVRARLAVGSELRALQGGDEDARGNGAQPQVARNPHRSALRSPVPPGFGRWLVQKSGAGGQAGEAVEVDARLAPSPAAGSREDEEEQPDEAGGEPGALGGEERDLGPQLEVEAGLSREVQGDGPERRDEALMLPAANPGTRLRLAPSPRVGWNRNLFASPLFS